MEISRSSHKYEGLDHRVPFTGIVVTYNEERHLSKCLDSLAFCEQLLVVDLGSQDHCVEIARKCGAEVTGHQWVPVVEQVWPDAVPLARNAWIIRADPDEVFPDALVEPLIRTVVESESLAVVRLPHQYYFCGKPLRTTIWGGIRYAPKVFHKDRVVLEPQVHQGIRPKNGYQQETILGDPGCSIHHYWADTVWQLIRKHWRYVRKEGEARHRRGERFEWHRWYTETKKALRQSLVDCNGLRGGSVGISLSLFYTWYTCMSLLSLWYYQRRTGSRG